MANMGEHASVIYGTHYPSRLFVGCLPETATACELGYHFSHYGKVVEAKILKDETGRSKRFGFVSFQHEVSVKRVIDERPITFKGKIINVGPAVKKDGPAIKKDGTDTPRSFSPNLQGSPPPSFHTPDITHVEPVTMVTQQRQDLRYQASQLHPQTYTAVPIVTTTPMITTAPPTIPTPTQFTCSSNGLQMVEYTLPMTAAAVTYQPIPAVMPMGDISMQCVMQNSRPFGHQHYYYTHQINNGNDHLKKELNSVVPISGQFYNFGQYNPYGPQASYPLRNYVF